MIGIATVWKDMDFNAYGIIKTSMSIAEILAANRRDNEGEIETVPFDARTVLEHIVSHKWEPVSALAMCATLLSVFGYEHVNRVARSLPPKESNSFYDE
jgi:hypothetical protein